MEVRETTEAFLEAMKSAYFRSGANGSADFLQGECRLLSLLRLEPEKKLQPGELSKRLRVSSARVASTLRTLEAKGYITREASPADKRKVCVSITPEGIGFIEGKRAEVCSFFDSIFAGLDEDECGEFIRLIKKLSDIADSKE